MKKVFRFNKGMGIAITLNEFPFKNKKAKN